MKPQARAGIAGAQPYGAPVADVAVRLNVNENPYSPPVDVVSQMADSVAEALAEGNRYPDREAIGLREAIAEYVGFGIGSAQIWAANGSNEIMHQLFSAFGGPGRTALSFTPTYSMYPQYARDKFTNYDTEPRSGDFSLNPAAAVAAISRIEPAIVVVPSPNNPTGHALDPEDIAGLLAACEDRGALLIVDEAYAEFMDVTRTSAMRFVVDSENLVVTRTLSKAFGLAGLRLGYAATSSRVVDSLRVVRLPYHLSSATQAAACVALDRSAELLAPVAGIRAERARMIDWAQGAGLQVTPSQGNFIYMGRFHDRHGVWQQLLNDDVLVRESGPKGWLRVSVGRPAENSRFMDVMSAVLNRDNSPISEEPTTASQRDPDNE